MQEKEWGVRELSWITTVMLAVRQFCAFVQSHRTGQDDDLCK